MRFLTSVSHDLDERVAISRLSDHLAKADLVSLLCYYTEDYVPDKLVNELRVAFLAFHLLAVLPAKVL